MSSDILIMVKDSNSRKGNQPDFITDGENDLNYY